MQSPEEPSERSACSVMDILTERSLREAGQNKRFVFQTSEIHTVKVYNNDTPTRYDISTINQAEPQWTQTVSTSVTNYQIKGWPQVTHNCILRGALQCFFQRNRPEHISRDPDKLPFENMSTCQNTLKVLGIPTSYLQIADGNPAVAVSQRLPGLDQHHSSFEFISHCNTRQGNWALSLAYDVNSSTTSVFWSVDGRIDSQYLLDELRAFQDHAYHPLLVPCIIFASILRANVDRRNSIKERLQLLETRILAINKRVVQSDGEEQQASLGWGEELDSVEDLFELLHGCRRDQSSREGRYAFWSSFHTAMLNGFEYFDEVAGHVQDIDVHKTNLDLKQWAAITWHRLESLKARDKDHISRVNNASDTLYNLIHRRDSRIQANIAKATQRDSEDMKFIALLGSVFLPAGLVASILNVQEFQFLPGSKLFGVYLAILVPFIGLVVLLCVSRPFRRRWRWKQNPLYKRT